jgi:hypothetical protein
MMWANDQSFEVGPSTATVAQFRILDFGMEECSLNIVVPAKGDDSTTVVEPDVVEVDIWRLHADRMKALTDGDVLDAPRIEFLKSVPITYGSNHSVPFECHSGDIKTFEFSSTSGKISLVPDRDNLIGPYIVQSQTI